MLMPGVVSDATNLVEHPQLVAYRILRSAAIVGCDNIVSSTDCATTAGSTLTGSGPSFARLSNAPALRDVPPD
jgi:hypothetical protein